VGCDEFAIVQGPTGACVATRYWRFASNRGSGPAYEIDGHQSSSALASALASPVGPARRGDPEAPDCATRFGLYNQAPVPVGGHLIRMFIRCPANAAQLQARRTTGRTFWPQKGGCVASCAFDSIYYQPANRANLAGQSDVIRTSMGPSFGGNQIPRNEPC